MVLIVSLVLTCLFVLWGILRPDGLAAIMQSALVGTQDSFGWLYLLSMFVLLIFVLYLAFGRFGSIRIGGDEAEPEFSTLSWFAMLFAAGMGIGLVFWGVAEPISHFATPPMGLDAESAQAARTSLRYTFFHWGLHPWAAYCMIGLALAFTQFNRGKPMLISSVFSTMLGGRVQRIVGPTVDILAIIATIFGVATSLGFGTLQIGAGLHKVLGLTNGLTLQLIIIAVAAVLYLISSMTGLDRGIQLLSNFNMLVALLLCVLIFILGPTSFILDSFVTTTGDYLNNLISMSMRLTPFTKGTWVANWTLFYWAWWIAWSPFVGMFIARISKGRTIREFVTGVLLAPSLVSFIWFSVFGGTALNFAMFGNTPLIEATNQDVSMALFTMLDHLPLPALTSLVAILLVIVFFVTSADSATFVLGMMSSDGNPHPSGRLKLIWGSLIALIAAVLLVSGGLKGLQTMSIVTALPFAVVMLGMCICLYNELNKEERRCRQHQHEKDRLLEKLLKDQQTPGVKITQQNGRQPAG